MSPIVERVPILLSAMVLLTGAMLFGAAGAYAFNTSVVFAEGCVPYVCDPGDPDDCPTGCDCNDPTVTCVE